MKEPQELASARDHLALAESGYRSKDGLYHLEEGLALLEEVRLDGEEKHRTVAANLLSAYSTRICASIRNLVETDTALPQPDLEHVFKVLLAFDSTTGLDLPEYVRSLKIDVARRLVDLYYEGYPAEAKETALQELAGIAKG